MTHTNPIIHLKREQINSDNWNSCIANSPHGQLYAYTEYLDIAAPQWEALVWGDYEAVMPLPSRRKWGIAYVYQPYWVQQLGVFSNNQATTPTELLPHFLNALPTKFRYIDLYLHEAHTPLPATALPPFTTLSPRTNYTLSLAAPYSQIAQHFDAKTNRNIRYAAAKKPRLLLNTISPRELVDFFRLHTGHKLPHLQTSHYDTITRLAETLQSQNKALLVEVQNAAGQTEAVNFFAIANNRLVNLLSALAPEGRRRCTMYWLLDQILRQYAESPSLILDFEGSMLPSIAYFFAHFGASPQSYWHIRANRLPAWARWVKE